MIEKLHDEGGIDISWEQMQEAFGEAVWTRAHFARYLLDHHYIKTMQEAFTRYVGDTCPYFVPREKVTPGTGSPPDPENRRNPRSRPPASVSSL